MSEREQKRKRKYGHELRNESVIEKEEGAKSRLYDKD